jgi:hypothetical protein
LQSSISKLEAERAEVDDLLSSGVFGRTNNNIARLLTFVCEKYFDGETEQVKEYSIAVHALGRPASFDPRVDTVVRVTAHALRKRLDDYYKAAGAEHAVHICLPPGRYIPKFIHRGNSEAPVTAAKDNGDYNGEPIHGFPPDLEGQPEAQADTLVLPLRESKPQEIAKHGTGRASGVIFRPWIRGVAAAVCAIVILVLSSYAWKRWTSRSEPERQPQQLRLAAPSYAPLGIVRAMMGPASIPYIGRDGFTWDVDHFCLGGTPFSVTGHAIQGTQDALLFSRGRRGIVHCRFPVPAGTYEVHLLFAETSGLQENSRNVGFSINGGPVYTLDVVDDAGGDDVATTKIFTDLTPKTDGTIHLDFTTAESFVNAIEILPGVSHRMLPVRIVVGRAPYRDPDGDLWVSDRYFFGGRVSSFEGDLSKLPSGIYQGHRFGHFHYVLPVLPGGKYTVKLYFMEHWFGVQNGGLGGVGSRVFDVYCNGSTLLKGFDILREGGSGPVVKTFEHIAPTPQGKIELYFIPDVNYPSISAIEIVQE